MPATQELRPSPEKGGNNPTYPGVVSSSAGEENHRTDISYADGETREAGINVSWSAWIPENPIYSGRMLVAGGWTSIPKVYDRFCEEMAKRGIATVNMETPRKKGLGAFSPLNLLQAWKNQSEAISAVEADTKSLLRTPGPDRSIYFAHSGSGPHAVKAAKQSPDNVDYVTLFGTAGQDGNNAATVLTRRLPWFLLKEGAPVMAKEAFRDPIMVGGYIINIALHPYEIVAEGISAGNSEIVDNAQKAEESGIKVVNIIPRGDELFRTDDVIAHIDGRVDLHQSELVGHLAPQTQPAESADEIITLHNRIMKPDEIEVAAAA